MVDVKPTASTQEADLFVPVRPGGDFEALHTLRGLIRGAPLETDASTGAPLSVLQDRQGA